ncbi:telomere binding protein [Cladophialophora chaetospira]|uniref:Telomere binding protein n=1 Tax=Cladophialophora chaetospira TaxID=386627 RepID=A0AA39CPD9_9EURO|nr:telomere binding protein [Cladophialophora chaetospira]
MEDLFKPIKTTRRVQTNIEKFETLSLRDTPPATPTSVTASTKSKISIVDLSSEPTENTSETFSLRPSHDSSITSRSSASHKSTHDRHQSLAFIQKSYLEPAAPASLPDDAREILKGQPEVEDLAAVLQYLQYGIEGKHDFNVHVPSPKASQIINVLVTVTVPDLWQPLQQKRLSKNHANLKANLLSSLTSVAGLGALLMQIKRLSGTSTGQQNPLLVDSITVMALILAGTQVLSNFLSAASTLLSTETQRRVFWQEVTALFAGSKILSSVAQVFTTNQDLGEISGAVKWLGDGVEYSKWLAKNISAAAVARSPTSDSQKSNMLSQFLKRALSLGYRDALITELYTGLLLGNKALWTPMHTLMQNLSAYDQKTIFDTILRDLARKFLQSGPEVVRDKGSLMGNRASVSGVAAMITGLVQSNVLLEAHVVHWLTSTNGEYTGMGLEARRAVIATLATSQAKLEQILEKTVETFGNKLQIQHDAILQQESIAQTILLAVGYLSRLDGTCLKSVSSSGNFIRMVSNRLSASVPRARFLGMIVAVAVSKLVDKEGKVMNFGVEEMESEEAKWWLDLIHVQDRVGDLEDLRKTMAEPAKKRTLPETSKPSQRKRAADSPQVQRTKIMAIEELSDSDETDAASEDDEDPDFRPYAAPDSDPEDSDDDPTLVNRNKPAAPVYITSLVKQLNASDDLPAVELALKTAPSLIRRKANFGDELSSNILPLASSLLNLREIMSMEDTQRLQLDSLIACLVSKPAVMGPWLASTYFEGDLSLSTRSVLLTTLALGARELAGLKDNVEETAATSGAASSSFPSKRLPPHLEQTYSLTSGPIDNISHTLSYQTLQPLALEAADKLTGPNILKVRTFSSRMEVAAKNAAKQEARSKRIPKDLHKLLAESMYLPLCSRLALLLSSLSTSQYLANSTLLHPSLLKLSLQTLIILIATMGPNALQLSTLTRESLLLLTTLHTLPSLAHDPIILPPTLHLLLTLLDLNVEAGATAEERLVTDFGPMIAELASWAASLGDRVSIPEVHGYPGLGMAMPWPVLVAGIQVKWQEVGRKFQGRMLGLMANTDFDSF